MHRMMEQYPMVVMTMMILMKRKPMEMIHQPTRRKKTVEIIYSLRIKKYFHSSR